MPRTPFQNEALRAATRAKLLDAALVLFARDGYADTAVRAIARRAGVSTGLLYAHFAGKEALLRELFGESKSQLWPSRAVVESAPREARIGELVRECVQLVREHRDVWRLWYAVRTQPAASSALAPALAEWSEAMMATLRGFLADAGSTSPELDAHALLAQIDGMCQHFVLGEGEYPVDAVADRVVGRWSRP